MEGSTVTGGEMEGSSGNGETGGDMMEGSSTGGGTTDGRELEL